MKPFFGYIRVSTARQGDHGVSLEVQREAILRHAQEHGFSIVDWFEERQTAAKRGRPLFSRMIDQLRQNRADGVIMHKIDRGARNLRDWADPGVHESARPETLRSHAPRSARSRDRRDRAPPCWS